jgi:putative nucleotidyltransferase with HDIG domain
MISYARAFHLLKKYGLSRSRIAHSRGVAAFAARLARRIRARNPALPVDPGKVRIAALLHDIGRALPGDHEPNSVEILRREGLHEIAVIVMHGTFYETSALRGARSEKFLPDSIENKIVAYADARFRLGVVTLAQRFVDVLKRRGDSQEKAAAAGMALERFMSLEQELSHLAGRKL